MDQTQQTGMPVAQPSGSKKGLIIGIIVVVVLIGAGVMIFGKNGTQETQGIVAGDNNSLAVGDQDADSVAVLLSDVQNREPSFVVIHSDTNGATGPIISSGSLLQPGDHKNVSVITKLTPGAYYWAMLHTDDGNGIFEAVSDKPTTDNSNKVVMVRFMVKLTNAGEEPKG